MDTPGGQVPRLMFARLEGRVLRKVPTMSDVPTLTPVHYGIAEILCHNPYYPVQERAERDWAVYDARHN